MRFKESSKSIERNRLNGPRGVTSMFSVESERGGHETPFTEKLKPRFFLGRGPPQALAEIHHRINTVTVVHDFNPEDYLMDQDPLQVVIF